MLTLKHEAFLAFVERLLHDREFSEWFASQPRDALATHGLSARDLRDVDEILHAERYEPRFSRALQPTITLLLELLDADVRPEVGATPVQRWARLQDEIQRTRERVTEVRATSRPWWKFW
ncbi:MAG TPA: hypothetical protein VFZ25_20835 [Chloroflexota bacterium]|nr:hypothetical protein [Chloroflexota bacterium]